LKIEYSCLGRENFSKSQMSLSLKQRRADILLFSPFQTDRSLQDRWTKNGTCTGRSCPYSTIIKIV
jgi:hypothetical protein